MSVSELKAKAGRRLGLKGIGMLILSLGWVAIGIQPAKAPDGSLFSLVPEWVVMIGWFATAAPALFAAWTRRHDWIGISALSLMPILLTVSYFYAYLIALLPDWFVEILPGDPGDGTITAWQPTIRSALLVAFVMVIANIVEAPARITPPPADEEPTSDGIE